jgi:hypothetical protein
MPVNELEDMPDGLFGKQTILMSNAQIQRFQDSDELVPLAHTEPSVASSSQSAPASDTVMSLSTRLADQLTRGFQSADDRFKNLQAQVTKGFQSIETQLQELEAEVA